MANILLGALDLRFKLDAYKEYREQFTLSTLLAGNDVAD